MEVSLEIFAYLFVFFIFYESFLRSVNNGY